MSLLYNDFKSKKELASDFCLMNLFLNSSIADASTLFLPATRLSDSCYNSMFSYCLQLAAAPKLPATELGVDCYRNMFLGSTLIKELHFPASVENNERFTSMYKSPTFGADNATAYFDL